MMKLLPLQCFRTVRSTSCMCINHNFCFLAEESEKDVTKRERPWTVWEPILLYGSTVGEDRVKDNNNQGQREQKKKKKGRFMILLTYMNIYFLSWLSFFFSSLLPFWRFFLSFCTVCQKVSDIKPVHDDGSFVGNHLHLTRSFYSWISGPISPTRRHTEGRE